MSKAYTKNHETNLNVSSGKPTPLGVSIHAMNWNFSIYADSPYQLELLLYTDNPKVKPIKIPFCQTYNQTGDIYHLSIPMNDKYTAYAYLLTQTKGASPQHLIDPYATSISSNKKFGEGIPSRTFAYLPDTSCFNWEGDKTLNREFSKAVIYEMHIRGFTQDSSSKVKNPGTFEGAIEKLDHLKSLGINTIELMPIQEFDESKGLLNAPTLSNYWGYSPTCFFSIMRRYSAKPDKAFGPSESFRQFVKECHKRNIEVLLDVVFNHTSEGGKDLPSQSFKGFGKDTYYLIDSMGDYHNFSGCGNTLNCNHPIVRDLIVDCLRYFVHEFHVDGFRFDLASIMSRGADGTPLADPPLIERIALDPILANTKLIAEAWDAGGLYQVGSFPSWNVWAEWNGQYRDSVRKFIKGTKGFVGEFAKRVSGSQDLYDHGRSPYHSINFITCHDGFTLEDLVSYNQKHNDDNLESNRDGSNDNFSWNSGHEGKTSDRTITELRLRQKKNFIIALSCSLGVPMIYMGDEYGRTKGGNNNTWCHDSKLNWFDWSKLKTDNEIYIFIQKCIQFRNDNVLFRNTEFLGENDVHWHSKKSYEPNWNHDNQVLAYTLLDHSYGKDLYLAFNASHQSVDMEIPILSKNHSWQLLVDTKLPARESFKKKGIIENKHYTLIPYSSCLMQRQS